MTEEQYAELLKKCSKSTKLRNISEVVPFRGEVPAETHRFIDAPLKILESKLIEEMNKTEREYWAWRQHQPDLWSRPKAFTLLIGDRCRFTPDFWYLDATGLNAVDTKGSWNKGVSAHIEDDALVKIKVAARLFPFIRFWIAWKKPKQNICWQHRLITP